jgi:hypothetical protein
MLLLHALRHDGWPAEPGASFRPMPFKLADCFRPNLAAAFFDAFAFNYGDLQLRVRER